MILCIGDGIRDTDRDMVIVRQSPEGDHPIVRIVRESSQCGGALAVVEMVEALGVLCEYIGQSTFGFPLSVKTRVRVDSVLAYRIDADVTTDITSHVVSQIRDYRGSPDVVLLSDYHKGAISRSVVEACLARGWRVVADPHLTTAANVFDGVYGITPNRVENVRWQYWNQPAAFERCCLKRDKDGMMVRDDSMELTFKSTITQPPFDTCGCGDSVLSTIGVMLSRGKSWREACEVANVAAGIKCGKRGATPVTSDELKAALDAKEIFHA
jgi:bifunctional ADP-heptose synthase (sugar kinase/adenylyltransferase)